MASEIKLEELKKQAELAGIGPGTLDGLIGNIYGFATNSGKRNLERVSDDQCDELILLLAKKVIEGAL